MTWTDPRTWVAGETVTAALLNTHLRDNLKAIGDPWTAYTTSWTASTTNPTLGNGTLAAAWMNAGKFVKFRIQLTFGSTTTVGSGTYFFTLPTSLAGGIVGFPLGLATFTDVSVGTTPNHRMATWATGTNLRLSDQAGTLVNNATIAWATGDTIQVQGSYEAA